MKLFEWQFNFTYCRYVPNPVKVLAEIKANGGDIETVEGEIVAGDAADVDVVSMKGNTIKSLSKLVFCSISLNESSVP